MIIANSSLDIELAVKHMVTIFYTTESFSKIVHCVPPKKLTHFLMAHQY